MAFDVKDCALIARMGGVPSAANLRELHDRIAVCPAACLFHHFCETTVRPSFDDPEFRNDLALWVGRVLRDRVLAERLGILNPYSFGSLDDLREVVLDLIEDRLAEASDSPTVPYGDEFLFMRAVTVVFDTGVHLESPTELLEALPNFSPSSIYYHFIEARRRTDGRIDDFTAWLDDVDGRHEALIRALRGVDFYYLTLEELRARLVATMREHMHVG